MAHPGEWDVTLGASSHDQLDVNVSQSVSIWYPVKAQLVE